VKICWNTEATLAVAFCISGGDFVCWAISISGGRLSDISMMKGAHVRYLWGQNAQRRQVS
jgi:hypothetical protein